LDCNVVNEAEKLKRTDYGSLAWWMLAFAAPGAQAITPPMESSATADPSVSNTSPTARARPGTALDSLPDPGDPAVAGPDALNSGDAAVPPPPLAGNCDTAICLPAPDIPAMPPSPSPKQPQLAGVPIGKPAQRALTQSLAWAENPAAMPQTDGMGRVMFTFGESAPTLVCAPIHVCDIQLQPGEVVQGSPHIGDAVRWKVAPAVSGSDEQKVIHLIVKPTAAGLDTNLIVPTDRHTYHLRLVSSTEHYVTAVAFDYPEEQQQAWANWERQTWQSPPRGPAATGTGGDPNGGMPAVAVDRINFNYRIRVTKGRPSFKAMRAMDDGYHTFVAMNEDLEQAEAPVLVGLSAAGEEQMINYRLKGNLYIADGTYFGLALLAGVGREQQRIELIHSAGRK
jgi:type IV secretion system protein TrbG